MYACQCRLRFGEYVDGSSSDKRFTLSTRQESRPAHRIAIPEGKQLQAGCIIYSVSSHENTSTPSSLGRVIYWVLHTMIEKKRYSNCVVSPIGIQSSLVISLCAIAQYGGVLSTSSKNAFTGLLAMLLLISAPFIVVLHFKAQ